MSKQASTTYGVCKVWKQELSTLIAIIFRSASSWFSANYTIEHPGRFLFGKFQEESIASSCLLLATPMPKYQLNRYLFNTSTCNFSVLSDSNTLSVIYRCSTANISLTYSGGTFSDFNLYWYCVISRSGRTNH